MNLWTIFMVVSGGLFAGGAMTFVWERIPAWRAMPLALFTMDFAQAIRRADRLQPAILIVSIVSALGFSWSATATGRTLALFGAAGFIVTLLASVAVLVPLQRQIIASSTLQSEGIDALRQWVRGHLGRSVLGLTSYVLVAAAAAFLSIAGKEIFEMPTGFSDQSPGTKSGKSPTLDPFASKLGRMALVAFGDWRS